MHVQRDHAAINTWKSVHIILERLQKRADERQNQADFRNGRSCSDQIATLRIIVEQSIEWKTPVYVNFIDFEKLWKLMAHYGIPPKYSNLIKNTYQGSSTRDLHMKRSKCSLV